MDGKLNFQGCWLKNQFRIFLIILHSPTSIHLSLMLRYFNTDNFSKFMSYLDVCFEFVNKLSNFVGKCTLLPTVPNAFKGFRHVRICLDLCPGVWKRLEGMHWESGMRL